MTKATMPGETQQFGNLAQWQTTLAQMALNQLRAHLVEQSAESNTLHIESTVQGAAVNAHVTRDFLRGACATREQREDELTTGFLR